MARLAATVGLALSVGSLAVTPFDIMTCPAGEPVLTTTSMTHAQYQDVATAVKDMWHSLSTSCTSVECQQASWAGCVLRVAGHDLMDFMPGQGGGSDGCTNLEADDNKGLDPCLRNGLFGQSLLVAYQRFCKTVSLADFLVIAAEAVMVVTRPQGLTPLNFASTFKFGRTTAKTCPGAGHTLPNPEGACDEVERVFLQNMGLDWRGSTAMMGVHTLGRARIESSGYDGWWSEVGQMKLFNNDYYKALVMKGWMVEKAVNGNFGKNQWRRSDKTQPGNGPDHQMMLNTDLCLAYDSPARNYKMNAANDNCCAWTFQQSLAGIAGEYCGDAGSIPSIQDQHMACCDGQLPLDCGNPAGENLKAFKFVKEFAQNDAAWIQAFAFAWTKATENGFQNLQLLLGDDGNVPDGNPSPAPSPSPPPDPNAPFDCNADFGMWPRAWSAKKKVWCCNNVGRGCYAEPDSYDCNADWAMWEKGWSEEKKGWCCKHTGKGCQTHYA